jgi:heme oxygenase (mycobilin-producing)
VTRFRVLVRHREPADRPGAVERAYREVRAQLAGTTGFRHAELLRDGSRYLLVVEWASEADFTTWEQAHRARGHPSALRPFQDRAHPGGHYETYSVTAGDHAEG